MKRKDFLKSIFAVSGVATTGTLFAQSNKRVEVDELNHTRQLYNLAGSGKVTSNPKTITINGCTQYLESNPTFNIGDDVVTVNGSDLSVALSKRRNSKFR